jgi:hypothetical protein
MMPWNDLVEKMPWAALADPIVTIIVGIIGFIGVIITLKANAKLA